MKPRVKLLTVWFGPLPPWYDKFLERVKANRIIDWELIQPPNVKDLNEIAQLNLGVPVRKETAYAACNDLRPFYGGIFKDLIGYFEWWGWVDLDVVLGDLDRLLPPLLDHHDIITTDANYIHGPLTMLRNQRDINALGRDTAAWVDVLADRDYWNFDETGFNDRGDLNFNGNPSFTKIVNSAERDGLKVCWDGRCWTDTARPRRGWKLEGSKLIETPTGRELVAYHCASKVWAEGLWDKDQTVPEPGIASDWRNELIAKYPTHLEAVKQLILPGQTVIDCGCGMGDLLAVLPTKVEYRGVDSCQEAVWSAAANNVGTQFQCMDLNNLGCIAKDSFDWAVCRGLEGEVKTQQGCRAWARMRDEMLRVAKRLLLMDYSGGWRVVERIW